MKKHILQICALTLAVMLAAPALGASAEDISILEALSAVGEQHAPTVGEVACETVKNIAVTCAFAGADADGDALTYEITAQPKKGEAVVSPEHPDRFVYTPAKNKTGTDSFTYVAVDSTGRRSSAAKATVRITKNAAKMTYADMDGDPAHLAAIKLAENGVLLGERLGTEYYFSPQKTVTRGEFTALLVTCLDLDVTAVSKTGFADDAETAAWLRPYAAAALRASIIKGSLLADGRAVFDADRAVTRAEAAVMLAAALSLPSATSAQNFGDMSDVPAWAEGAVAGALAAGIMDTRADGSLGVMACLTRAEAAEMLYAAMRHERAKETSNLLTRIFA